MSAIPPDTPADDEGSFDGKEVIARVELRLNTRYSNDEDCNEALYKLCGLLKCHYCQSTQLERVYGARTALCRSCGKNFWLTAGTFFHGMRSPRAWLAAIMLMEQRVTISALALQKLGRTAYATALAIHHKVWAVANSMMKEDCIEVSSSQFVPVICRRSRETPARQHPIAEQELIDSQCQDHPSDESSVTSPEAVDDGRSPEQMRIFENISEQPVSFESLRAITGIPPASISASLTMLELEGLVQRLPGDRYVRSPMLTKRDRVPLFPGGSAQESDAVSTALDFVRLIFKGISRKYLQSYLAAHWCRSRKNERSGWLFRACHRFGRVTYAKLISYVTPPVVKLLCLQEPVS